MGKEVIRLNEEQLNSLIRESVIRVISESEDEGLFQNIGAGIKQVITGKREGDFNDSDISMDFADANTNANNMINGVKSKKDAAKVYTQMIKIAREYEEKSSELMKKLRTVAGSKDIDWKQNRKDGKFASGHNTNDTSRSRGMSANGGLGSTIGGHRSKVDARSKEMAGMSAGWDGTRGTRRESFERGLDRIVNESIYKVINESEDERIDIRRGVRNFMQGFKSRREADRDMYRYQNDFDHRQDDMFGSNKGIFRTIGDWFNNKDAQEGVEEMSAMAKDYRERAQAIRAKAKDLAEKWGVGIISQVGQKGPVQYGYKRKPTPGTQTVGA